MSLILTKHAILLLVGEENRYIWTEPTIGNYPNELKERNGNASGGPAWLIFFLFKN